MEQPIAPQRKTLQLTTNQGLLMLAVLVIFFGGIMYWTANRYPRSYSGTVKTAKETLVPYGCNAEGPRLHISLRPEPQEQGFHEENRQLIFQHNITERSTFSAIPAKVVSVSWRDADKNVTPINCSKLDDAMNVFLKRRGGKRIIRDDVWSGTVRASCDVPGAGTIDVDVTVENCGF